MADKSRCIDVHHHILPPEYVTALQSIAQARSGGAPLPSWSVEEDLALMDEQGIDTAFVSVSAPGVYFGDAEAARKLAWQCNEIEADLIRSHPGRFGAFGSLPLPDVDGALAEIAYIFDVLHLDGVILQTSVGDQYLGDPMFDPVFDELNRRKAVAFVHPTVPPASEPVKINLPPFLVDFTFDTTRAVANLLFTGTLRRCPDIAFILSHAGGAIPYLAGRIEETGKRLPQTETNVPDGITATLKRLYYDTALSAYPPSLAALTQFVPATQILFGTDWPYVPEAGVADTVAGIRYYPDFGTANRELVMNGNAWRLLSRLRTPAGIAL